MKEFLRTFFAAFVAGVVLLALVFFTVVVIGVGIKAGKPDVEKGSYLVVDIYGDVLAYDPPESFPESILRGGPETLHRILGNLEKAGADDRIAGVIFKLSSHNGLGYGMIQEIRGAIHDVRETGKPVYAYTDDLDRKTLFLAGACDSIFMAPPGELFFVGMATVTPHVRGTLDKLGVKADVHRIKDYKSAAEVVTRKDMSPQTREMYGWILDDLWQMQMKAIAEDRGIAEEKIPELMDYAIFLADEARDAGLIDGVLYWSQLKDRLKGDDENLKTVSQERYAKVERKKVGLEGKKKIAVVHAHGSIGGRKSRIDPMWGMTMGHETVSANLHAAGDDDDVAAVIFRIDSGGGESLASDIISHAVEEVAAQKPVIVSMIDVAASGGYYIAYKGTRIIADEATITGSIGSISGKFNDTGMFGKLGVTFDWVQKGPNGLMLSSRTDFTDKQWQRFTENHWEGFNRWLRDVAERRGMKFEDAEKLAHGRVWTGRQAKENGLIDDIGGLKKAIEVAKDAAGIGAAEKVTLIDYPKKKGLLASITEDGPMSLVRSMVYRFVREDLAESYRQWQMRAEGALVEKPTR